MPFNATQRSTLRQSMRVMIDEAIENNAGKHLVETISPLPLRSQPELKTHLSEDVINFVLCQRNISSQVREGWCQIRESMTSGAPLSEKLLKDLSSTPNYDPQRIVELKCFEISLRGKGLSSKALTPLMRIREAYLGTTPIDNYSYGQAYPTFAFHIGEIPLNLDKMGSDFTMEELQGDIEEIVTERVEIWNETQKELEKLRQENNSLARKLDVAVNQTIGFEKKITKLKTKLELAKAENTCLGEKKPKASLIDFAVELAAKDPSLLLDLFKSGLLKSSYLPDKSLNYDIKNLSENYHKDFFCIRQKAR